MPFVNSGEILSLTLMSIALGLDAFSVGLAMGMQQLRLKRIFIVGLSVGIFHIAMPFIGIVLGQFISSQLEGFAVLGGGLLLFGLGAHMVFNSFHFSEEPSFSPVGIGLFLFSLSVSLDSFPVGISLGMSGGKTFVALLFFGIASTLLTWTGLLLGKRARGLLGVYSELLGGVILCVFGLRIIFG
ncbi:manganese efflux pump MntP family protein [Radiobacillus sp. PE A8.2]|uniref:manganese efflux pump MntP n=1 Tax=Radiobacillus sp. PE A8.2 TaxID=3380349 RepID=UPI00388F4505